MSISASSHLKFWRPIWWDLLSNLSSISFFTFIKKHCLQVSYIWYFKYFIHFFFSSNRLNWLIYCFKLLSLYRSRSWILVTVFWSFDTFFIYIYLLKRHLPTLFYLYRNNHYSLFAKIKKNSDIIPELM